MFQSVRQEAAATRLAKPAVSQHPLGTQDRRLSVSQCRKLLGNKWQLSDEQVETLRDEMYGLGDVITSEFLRHERKRERVIEGSTTVANTVIQKSVYAA